MAELPESFKYIWDYFLRLNQKRTSNGFGVNPLSYTEVKNFFELLQITTDPFEVEVLMLLDNVAMEHFQKESEKNNKKNKGGK